MTHSIHRRVVVPVFGLMMLAAAALPAQRETKSPAFTPLDSSSAPAGLATLVTLHFTKSPLRTAISDLAKQANVSIVFDPALADLDRLVSLDVSAISAARALLRLLDGTSIRAMVSPSGSIVLVARVKHDDNRPLVSGLVVEPRGPLAGAHVSLVGTRFAATTDASGRFTLGNVPRGDYTLHCVRIGFAPVEQAVRVDSGDASQIALSMTPK
jgi:TonB-dependent starch-binding outer membrane protein SusC